MTYEKITLYHSQVKARRKGREYLLEGAQQHFIADHKNAVQRGYHKLLYPVVLYMSKKRVH